MKKDSMCGLCFWVSETA